MQIETLRDVLHWTQRFHRELGNCMHHCSEHNESERARLLLDYLTDHENTLVTILDGFEETANEAALNTWCIEYIHKHPILLHEKCELPFSTMNASEIIAEVCNLHEQVTDLYKYLHSRAESASARELLAQLSELELHEAMSAAQAANRLQDL